MTYQSFSNNDDDLFSYDPLSAPINESVSKDNLSSSDIIQSISKRVEETKDDNILGSYSTRIRFAQSLLIAYTEFVSFGAVFFHKAVHQSLDTLTSGHFSLLYMFNYLEYNILRRINIKYLLENTFIYKEKVDLEEFKKFVDKTGLNLDESFISMYIKTNLDINDHVINNERAMYLLLADKLQTSPHPVVVNPNPTIKELSDSFSSDASEHHELLFNNIFASLADSEYLKNLSDLASTKVGFTKI